MPRKALALAAHRGVKKKSQVRLSETRRKTADFDGHSDGPPQFSVGIARPVRPLRPRPIPVGARPELATVES